MYRLGRALLDIITFALGIGIIYASVMYAVTYL